MHQISLLGGLGSPERHGSGSHFMRPDRVYKTSVLSPMDGYIPGYDVQQVAREFTQGPYTGMIPSGLGGLRGTFGDKVKAWWHGVKMRASGAMPAIQAAVQAQSAAAAATPVTASEPVVHAPGASPPPSRTGWGGNVNAHGYSIAPMVMTANMVGPYGRGIPGNMVTTAYGQSPSLPTFASDAAAKTTMMMWRGLRWPWH